ncbi:hypothetical protein [Mucilaginibacter sp.]|jgi:hypothetical protein|uniref:hypothetical protein n=1 Tax=Mucilaginibacter sp. TaxID=1882438 RepID=UPI00356AE4B6
MKNVSSIICLLILSFFLASCTNKGNGQIACTAQYVLPSLNFQVINETDLTMPVYTATDIKIYLKTDINKTDTISPALKSASDQRYFSFDLRRVKQIDTCYIRVANLKTDTLVYAVSNTSAPCPRPYISKITINRSAPLPIAPNTMVQLKVTY